MTLGAAWAEDLKVDGTADRREGAPADAVTRARLIVPLHPRQPLAASCGTKDTIRQWARRGPRTAAAQRVRPHTARRDNAGQDARHAHDFSRRFSMSSTLNKHNLFRLV